MKRFIWLWPVLFVPAIVLAQGPESATARRQEMKRLDWLLGRWEGVGWIQLGAKSRKEFTQVETVGCKLDGLVFVIEGQGKSKADGSAVHDALAFVSYDAAGKSFRWRAFTAEGRDIDTAATVTGKELQWGLDIPPHGRMRYTIRLNDNAQWYEVGEMSQDGQTWQKFFEMTLQRQP